MKSVTSWEPQSQLWWLSIGSPHHRIDDVSIGQQSYLAISLKSSAHSKLLVKYLHCICPTSASHNECGSLSLSLWHLNSAKVTNQSGIEALLNAIWLTVQFMSAKAKAKFFPFVIYNDEGTSQWQNIPLYVFLIYMVLIALNTTNYVPAQVSHNPQRCWCVISKEK